MEVNSELSKMYFLDDSFEWTTGNSVWDGMINGFCTILVLGAVSFVMLAFVLYDFRRIVKAWLTFSCLLILFGVSGQTLWDLFVQIFDQNDENQFILTVALTVVPTVVYGCLGVYAFLANGSISLHQFFVVSNCSLIAVFYLRAFPRYTTWFVLWAVLFWDLFAVLAPMGPLKKVQEKASDYSNNILKFLMFAADDRQSAGIDMSLEDMDAEENLNDERKLRKDVKQLIQLYTKKEAQDDEFLQKIRQRRTAINPDSGLTAHSPMVTTEPSPMTLVPHKEKNSDDEESDTTETVCSTSSSSSSSSEDVTSSEFRLTTSSEVSTADECAPEEWNALLQKQHEFDQMYEPVTAADALNDGETVRLGFGDFVFYSLLIGQAATGGCPVSVGFAAFGILFGLVATLTVLSSEESTTPALPLPVICGTCCYFVSRFLIGVVWA